MLYTLHGSILRLVRSQRFFYIVAGLLVVQSGWIALTARYPQAYDENFHFGLIQLHAKQLLPFFTHQPPTPAIYGAVVRDPSYLYHYVLSLPYFVLEHLTTSQTAQIIVLRFINIALFTAGLFVYRKLFDELHTSVAIRNVVLLFFVLLPTIPLLVGQLNYDNLMFLFAALLFLYTLRFSRWLEATSNAATKRPLKIPLLLILKIVTIGAAGSIVTFPFTPIFLAVIVILTYLSLVCYRQTRRRPGLDTQNAITSPDAIHTIKENFWQQFDLLPRGKLIIFGILTVLMIGLCVERYGINILRYHNPLPDCGKVLSVQQCQAYAPWARNYEYAVTYPHPNHLAVLVYPAVWIHRMVYETMFTITSYFAADGTVDYNAYPPLTIANYTAWVIVVAGGLLTVRYFRRVIRGSSLRILLLIAAFYILVLFGQNLKDYLQTGEVVGVHGRYLASVYPILLLVLALCFQNFLIRRNLKQFQTVLLVVTLLLFMQGGGIVDWIVQSNQAWYWQQSQPAARTNQFAQDILDKIVVH